MHITNPTIIRRFIRIQRRFTESTHPSDNESPWTFLWTRNVWRMRSANNNYYVIHPSNSEISLRIARRRQSFVIIRYANRLSRKRSESRVRTEAYLLERDSCGEPGTERGKFSFSKGSHHLRGHHREMRTAASRKVAALRLFSPSVEWRFFSFFLFFSCPRDPARFSRSRLRYTPLLLPSPIANTRPATILFLRPSRGAPPSVCVSTAALA